MGLFSWKKKSPDAASRLTRLFFASDFHGSDRIFRKFVNAAKHYDAQVLIMGGDVVGKIAVPIIRDGKGGYRATLVDTTEHLADDAALGEFEQRLKTLGFYSQVMDEDEYQAIAADEAAIDRLFYKLAWERLSSWVELAETRLKDAGVKIYVMGGNDDDPEVLDMLKAANSDTVIYCENQEVAIDDNHTMISCGFSNRTPWNTPREVDDEELGRMIESMAEKVSDPAHAIFNFHVPPVDSTLDTCPELDWTTDPPSQIVKGGQVVLHGAGSKAVRRAIEQYQPMLSLHGHIHESGGIVKIGRTTSINPGSEYGEGILRGCLLTLGKDEVKSYQLTAG